MPLPAENEANESRTKSVGTKRSLATSHSAEEPHLKRRKCSNRASATKPARRKDQAGTAGMGSSPSQNRSGVMAWNNGSASTIRTSLRPSNAPSADLQLGNNRLAVGFASTSAPGAPSPESLESGETHSTPIEISSDEEDSAGGMEINVEGQATPEVINLDSNDEEDEESDDEIQEEGEYGQAEPASTSASSPTFGDTDAHMQLQGELQQNLAIGPTKKQPIICLADLSAEELETQFRYCFYHVSRDRIDLNHPAVCIECFTEGHTDSTCLAKHCLYCEHGHNHSKKQCPNYRRCKNCRERGHDAKSCQSKLKAPVVCDCCGSSQHVESDCTIRFFPPVKLTWHANARLWISCCNCGSKTHLVGDCRAVTPDHAPRWSLRSLDPTQITNLSLQTGVINLEKAAENRGMRPQGRDIRPARQQRAVNQKTTFDDDSEDDFLHPPVSHQTQTGKIAFAPPRQRDTRYDRYDAPSAPNSLSRGDWYSTDSFGQRRRSRSPDPGYNARRDDSYRPYDQPSQQRSYANQYPRDVGYGRGPHGNAQSQHWEPPLPAGPPPAGDNYRPAAALPARPPRPARRRQGRGDYRPPR